MADPLRILVPEDSEDDFLLLERHLKARWPDVVAVRVDSEPALREALKASWDVVAVDFNLPGLPGLRAIEVVHSLHELLPVIVISGSVGEECAVEAMRAGARDFVSKQNLSRLVPAIEREIRESRLEMENRRSAELFRATFEQNAVGIGHADMGGRFVRVNGRLAAMLGYTPQELIGRHVAEITYPGDPVFDGAAIEQVLKDTDNASFEKRYVRRDGSIFWVLLTLAVVRPSAGSDPYIIGVMQDINDRKANENALRLSEERFRLSEERFRLVSAATDDAIFDWDLLTGRFWSNQRYVDLFGEPPANAEKRMAWWRARIHADDRDGAWSRAFPLEPQRDELQSDRYRMIGRQGQVIPILERRLAVVGEDGRLKRVIGSMTDLTEVTRAQEALVRSEAKFRRVFESRIIGVSFWKWDGTVVDANDTYLHLLRYTRDDLRRGAVNWRRFGTPKTEPQLALAVAEVLSTGVCAPYERDYVRSDGTVVPVLVTASALPDSDYDGVSMVIDMTERHRAVEALRSSEERFRQLLEHGHDFVTILDAGLIIRFSTGPTEALLGLRRTDLVGMKIMDFAHPDEREQLERYFKQLLSGEGPALLECRCRAPEGWRWLEVVGTNLLDHPAIEGIVLNARDVTERRLFSSQLEQSERMASLGRLAATIAHEFNNVLMGIQPFAEMIRRQDHADPRFAFASGHIETSIARGKRVTQEILRFSRDVAPDLTPMEVARWLGDIRAEMQALVGPHVELHILAPQQSSVVTADRSHLTQVLTNLLVNARDAMEGKGSVTISVDVPVPGSEIDLPDRAAFCHLAVRDSGPGMNETTLQRVFEPFFTTKQNGTGLGLAIAKQAVLKHGGHLFVESGIGEGTTFHIFLLRSEQALAADSPAEPLEDRRRIDAKILLVEDDPSVAAGVTALLEMDGFTVLTVDTGSKALASVETFSPSVVVLDIGLPDIDGLEVCCRIRESQPHLPVIFSSGHGDQSKVAAGGDPLVSFIQKPYAADALKSVIAEALEARVPADPFLRRPSRGTDLDR